MAVRDAVRNLPAYRFVAHAAPVKLDQNESPYDLPDSVKAAIAAAIAALPFNRYPSIDGHSLRRKLAELHDWPEEGVVVSGGSNVLIQSLVIACGLDSTVLTVSPTFPVYALEARILGSHLIEVPLTAGFGFPLQELLREVRGGGGVAFIANPAAPTGNRFADDDIERLATGLGPGWVLVLDEAYSHFAGRDHLELVRRHAAVASLRTFSKAFALAGVRLGYGLMAPELATEVRKVGLPFSLSALQLAVAETVLDHLHGMNPRIDEILAQREVLAAGIDAVVGLKVFPSDANFVLFSAPDAAAVHQGLLERGVLIRRQDHLPGLAGCLRVTVGLPVENRRFLEALEDTVANLREAIHG